MSHTHTPNWPQDKENILWQITCDWRYWFMLNFALYYYDWIIFVTNAHSPSIRHLDAVSLACIRKNPEERAVVLFLTTKLEWQPPFLDKYRIYFHRHFLLFLNHTVDIRSRCIHVFSLECWFNFTGYDLKFKYFSIHLCTWSAHELTCALQFAVFVVQV